MNMTDDSINLLNAQGWLDHLTYHLVRYKFASRMIRLGDVVLDYGCGTGYGSRFMAEYAHQVHGVDADEKSIRCAKSQYQLDNLEFHCDNYLDRQPITRYHLITCMEVVEHFHRDHAIILLNRLAGLLVSDGILVLSTPRFKPIPERSPVRAKNHLHEYTFDDLNDLLSSVFRRHLIFTQTDEIISMGNPSVCWTYIGVCW